MPNTSTYVTVYAIYLSTSLTQSRDVNESEKETKNYISQKFCRLVTPVAHIFIYQKSEQILIYVETEVYTGHDR